MNKEKVVEWLDSLIEEIKRHNEFCDNHSEYRDEEIIMKSGEFYAPITKIHVYTPKGGYKDFVRIAEAVDSTVKFLPYDQKESNCCGVTYVGDCFFEYKGWKFYQPVRETEVNIPCLKD